MSITQTNLDYMASMGCKLFVSGVEAYVGQIIPPAPTFKIDIIDGSFFPTGVGQYVTTNTTNNFNMASNTSNDKKTITQKFSSSPTWVEFNLTTIPYYTFNQTDIDNLNAQNVNAYINDISVIAGSKLKGSDVLKLVCNTGYKFDVENTLGQNPQPRYIQQRMTGTNSSGQMSLNDNGTIATLTVYEQSSFYIYNSFSFLTVEYVPVEPPPPEYVYTFTQADIQELNSNKAYMKVNGVIVTVGTGVENYGDVFLYPNEGYILDLSGCYFTGYDDYNYQDTFYFNGSENSASLAMYAGYSYNSLTVKTVKSNTPDPVDPDPVDPDPVDPDPVDPDPVDPDPVDPDPVDPDPSFRFTYDSSLRNTVVQGKCKLFRNGTELAVNAGFNNGDLLKLVPNSGYELNSAVITCFDENNYYIEQTFVNGELIVDIPDGYDISYFTIDTTQIDIVAGTNNLYKITKADLKQINIDRFETVGTSPPTVIDYGDNILGVINLPFNISPDLIQNPELIKLGRHETTVTAPKVITDKLYLDLGNINVPLPENSLGFTNTRALIHLPFANSLTLDISDVLGQIINVEYVIDLYNGNSYVNVKSDKSDSIIATNSVDLGVTIPYSSMNGNNNAVYNSNMSLGGDNHVKTPYIEIIQNIPILGNGFFTAPITVETTLASEQGFIQVNEIKLNVSATSDEKDMILLALKNGVIIQ